MTGRAISRTRWLSELSDTLDRAGRLTIDMIDHSAQGGDIALLRARIVVLSAEVDQLRRARPAPSPDWAG
ncbi:MAG: hypothetical protein M3Q57_06325 [Pseudomonadota bacterium]|nr:hypothetical protein [Pseudomonadota bacterium]